MARLVFFRTFLVLICLSVYVPSHAEIYKWVDENGKVQFSDRKDRSKQQQLIVLDEVKSDWSRFDIDVKAVDVDLTEAEHRDIVDGVNHVYEFFDRVLHFDIYRTVPVNILILKDQEAYREYLTQRNRARVIASYGVYFPDENQIVVYIREDRDGSFRTIRHEVSHAIVDTIMPYVPAWLNEGLAEQMETIRREKGGLLIGPHDINRRVVEMSAQRGTLTNISAFLKLPSRDWRHSQADGKRHLQSQAGQFERFLLATSPNRSFLVRIMHRFERGDRKLAYYLVDDNYIGGIASLEIAWRKWVREGHREVVKLF